MKHDNRVGRWRLFQGPILTLAMLSIHLWIKQLRRRRILAWRDSTQQLCISFEQSVNRLGHLTGHATDHPLFPDMGMCPFVIGALGFDQSLIQVGPFVVPQANGLEDDQKQHLLHRPGPSTCQSGAIIGGSCLFSDGSPAEVRFESRGPGKIVDRADGSHHRSDPWERQEEVLDTGGISVTRSIIPPFCQQTRSQALAGAGKRTPDLLVFMGQKRLGWQAYLDGRRILEEENRRS
jgi:hypothetical protein